MTDLANWIHGGTRRLGLAAALVGAAMFLAPGAFLPAAAARTEKADLSLGAGGTGSDASGRIRLKQQRRGERLKIRLDNLRPRSDYQIRDGATGGILGTIRTDRRGRARKTLRAGEGLTFSGASLEICEPGSPDAVLEGMVPGDGNGMPWFDGSYRIGTVSTDPEAAVQVSITLSSTSAYSPDGEGVRDGTYDSISLFAGPGGVRVMEDGVDRGIPEFPSIPGPVTFWIADGERGLVQVASIDRDEYGMPVPMGDPSTGGNGVAGVARHRRHHRIQHGAAALRDLPGGVNDGGDGTIFPDTDTYSWYADNVSDEGLPLGVGSVADLSGRRFEVKDGEGTVLLEGVLPELEEVVFEPIPDPNPDPMPCPGGDINIDITIDIDLSGIDWSTIDWGTFDWSSFDWGSLDLGALLGGDGSCFDFSKLLEEFRY